MNYQSYTFKSLRHTRKSFIFRIRNIARLYEIVQNIKGKRIAGKKCVEKKQKSIGSLRHNYMSYFIVLSRVHNKTRTLGIMIKVYDNHNTL